MNYDIHETECEEQPDEFPCICQQLKDRREEEAEDTREQEATGN